ncbi:MAG TPA: putative Ig domain-containing protein, partial [Longimicrobiales bacterium]|nr:putative Ig domain-containing protein [Longimicrobiales bacterium]
SAVYEAHQDSAIRFLYEVEACRGSIDIPPVEVSPADGTAFAPGSVVTLSGRGLAPEAGRFVSAVLVNGEPVDSLDASGRFFKTVRIAEGENLFVVQVVEPGCGESELLLRLLGLTDGVSGLEGYSEATAQLQVEYADTTFLRTEDALVVRARVRNVSTHPVRGPILMALTGLTPASASLRGMAGLTDRGEPFTVLLESGTLAPGAAGPYVYLVFSNPDREPVRHGVRWLVPADRPPYFESAPQVKAVVGQPYRYVPIATDPDLDPVVLALERGPAGMTLGASGTLSWTPGPGDVGAHDVALVAMAAGASATQGWTLTVSETSPNRPPFFTTAPVTSTAVGSSYLYDADASDPEGDAIAYSLLEGPSGMVAGAGDGRVTWAFAAPGEHRVSLRAVDGEGGEAVQSFLLAVGTLPSNPSAPRITSAPAVEGREGILYVYQPVASDPDGDLLQFMLEESPAGMTVDERGRVSWTPAADQVGTHRVSLLVQDGRGGETLQTFEIVVQGGEANLAPVIESVPGGFTLVGAIFRYQVEALDPDGDSIRFALASSPGGMSMNTATGLVQWTPAAGAAGTHVVGVEAIDTEGAVGRQVFELRVRAANAAPRITSPPPSVELKAGQVYQHDVEAEDADGDLLRYELAAGPPAVTVHAITGLVTWITTPSDVGQHAVTVRVVDPYGGQAESSFTVTVTPDEEVPMVAIGFSAAPA